MRDAIINIDNLGKKYSLRHRRDESYTTLRDALSERAAGLFGRARSRNGGDPTREEFWALKDVSFEVRQGEVVGIIGRNGAGKSTLLKILSRITEPTEGRVRIRGRVASLLEVGTGFHPELTGRENIFLNGAILGMTRAEIRASFDEIVAFAEIDRFLDTPVKRYSSGMYVRLAFAVAAHLEPEILIVDEVLAVGDAEFQKKCLGRISEVATDGRTVLFVSHNMAAVKRLCSRVIYLVEGKIACDDEVEKVVSIYLNGSLAPTGAEVSLDHYADRSGDRTAKIVAASLRNENGRLTETFSVGDAMVIEFRVRYAIEASTFSHSIEIANSDGVPIYHLWDVDAHEQKLNNVKERKIRAVVPDVNLAPDRYFVTLWVGDTNGARADRVLNCLSFNLEQANASLTRHLSKTRGLIYKRAEWSYHDSTNG